MDQTVNQLPSQTKSSKKTLVGSPPVVLISVSSSIVSGGLHSLARSLCRSAQVVHVPVAAAMPKMVRDLHPQIVMLDTMLYGSDIPDTLEAIRESWGHTRCVVLVDDPQQVIEAEKAGADLAILEGFPAQKLAAELSTLCGIPVTTCHSKYLGMPSTKISGVKHYGG